MLLEQHVSRLDIAVKYPFAMRIIDCSGDVAGDVQYQVERKLRLTLNPRFQRVSADVRHHVVEKRARFLRIQYGQYVGMTQPGENLNFTVEPGSAQNVCQLRSQHLDGYWYAGLAVLCQVDGGHSAAPQNTAHLVALCQRLA